MLFDKCILKVRFGDCSCLSLSCISCTTTFSSLPTPLLTFEWICISAFTWNRPLGSSPTMSQMESRDSEPTQPAPVSAACPSCCRGEEGEASRPPCTCRRPGSQLLAAPAPDCGECPVHRGQPGWYCLTEGRAVCAPCAIPGPCSKHLGASIGEAAGRMRNKLVDDCEKLQLRLASVERFTDGTLNKKRRSVKADASSAREQVIQRLNFIREMCDNEEQRLLEVIHDEEERVQQSILTQNTYWMESQQKLADIKNYLVDIVTKMDDTVLVKHQKEIFERAEEAEGILEPEDSNKLNFNLACVHSHLLSNLWASAAMICIPVAENLHIDEKTLHSSLTLSESKKRLSFVRKKVHLYPDCPERFEHWPNALGLESFQRGICTWRVDVENSCAYKVGLAYSCLPRKGTGHESRLGYNSSSWVFSRYDEEYTVAHDGQLKTLDLLRRPKLIGVLVDYDGGEILFYDADACAIIHSYRTKLSSPVHAAFAVADNCITIVQ
ncbi:B box and SPRY domain-containing protein [Chiloscyllium plagiosum]|uniref:B box and SPRY domain-containing protein n=1 Tax=Chiloscyllium plagiosum TaxID=36176 RepID=UPI001CB86275|nr:B box and SPRY domain-containing protein [Chiloscyllium plagiosum]